MRFSALPLRSLRLCGVLNCFVLIRVISWIVLVNLDKKRFHTQLPQRRRERGGSAEKPTDEGV